MTVGTFAHSSVMLTLGRGHWYIRESTPVQIMAQQEFGKCSNIPFLFKLNLCFDNRLAPKNFPLKNLPKYSLFCQFSCPDRKNKLRARVRSILMPPTFHIASLNRHTPKFSGVNQNLTWSQQFVLRVLPKWCDADFCPMRNAVFSNSTATFPCNVYRHAFWIVLTV